MNNKTYKLMFAILLMLVTSITSYSQIDSSDARKFTDKMKGQLSLTNEQYNKILPLNQALFVKMNELKVSDGSKLTKLKALKSIDADRDKTLKKVLTDTQYKTFQDYKKANREIMKERYKDAF